MFAYLDPTAVLALIDAAEAARQFVVEQDGLVDEVAGDQLDALDAALTKFAWNNEP